MCTCTCGSTLNAAPIVMEVDLVGAHNGGDTDIHKYLSAWHILSTHSSYLK
jgi:hypothetical protein